MKIAFLSTFYPFRGGIAQYNAALYRAFEACGHEIQAFNFSLQFPELLFPGTTQFVQDSDAADPVPSIRCLNSVNPVSYWHTAKKIKAYQPDLLLIGYFTPYLAPALGSVAKLLASSAIPSIAILNNLYPHEPAPFQLKLINYFLQKVDGYMVMGQEVENQLRSLQPSAKFLKFPHPVYRHFGEKRDRDTEAKALGVAPEKRVLLFFGLIRPYKGLDVLLEAFANLNPAHYHLVIAGEPYEDFDKYKALLEKLPKSATVTKLLKYLDDVEVAQLFSAADLVVLPYRSATQSGVTAIASHFEVPVIVTDKGNLREHIEPFGIGKVIDEADAELLKIAIEHFFEEEDPKAYQENIVMYNRRFTWELLAEKLMELGGQLAQKKGDAHQP